MRAERKGITTGRIPLKTLNNAQPNQPNMSIQDKTPLEYLAESEANCQRNVALLRRLLTAHPLPAVPKYIVSLSIDCAAPMVMFHCACLPESQRDRVLAHVGGALGTDGWTRDDNGGRHTFDWHKDVDGIKVIISGAERIEPISTPVPPNKFPLLLTDSEEV